MIWMLLVLVYGLLKGGREIIKKLAMSKNTVMEVLVVYTFVAFLFVIPQAPNAGGLEFKYYFYIAIKSFCIFLAWICSFNSLKKLPVSLYGILDLSRMLFATLLGVIFLSETLSYFQIAGLIIVCCGLLLLRFKPKFIKKLFHLEDKSVIQNDINSETEKSHSTTFFVILAFTSCILNAISGFLDKVLMKDINSSQLQFWYMLFLILYYVIYVLITRTKIRLSSFKNIWIWILAIIFVIGDKALFIANGDPASKITIMTLIKQSGCLVTIIGGRIIFKEKNIVYKIFCALIIVCGIVLGVLK